MSRRRVVLCAAAVILAYAGAASAQDAISACLITKTETNPFFVKMKQGANVQAKKLGAELLYAAGVRKGDIVALTIPFALIGGVIGAIGLMLSLPVAREARSC